VRHRRRADLARLEPLGRELLPGHEPDRRREARRARGHLHQRGRRRRGRGSAGRPARRCPAGPEPEVGRDPVLELVEPVEVAAEQVEHVLLGADRPLDAAQRVAGEELLDPAGGLQQLLPRVGEPLAERGRLGRDVVAAAGEDQRGVLGRPVGEQRQRATHRSRTCSRERRTCSCSTFSVRSREVIPLWTCSWPARAQNSSMRAFTSWRVTRSRAAIEARSTWSTTRLVGLDDPVRHVDAEVALGAQHGEPQLPFEHHLALGRPQVDDRLAGVPRREDVGDAHVGWSPRRRRAPILPRHRPSANPRGPSGQPVASWPFGGARPGHACRGGRPSRDATETERHAHRWRPDHDAPREPTFDAPASSRRSCSSPSRCSPRPSGPSRRATTSARATSPSTCPTWAPPQDAFGLVWPVLYVLIAAAAWRVWRVAHGAARRSHRAVPVARPAGRERGLARRVLRLGGLRTRSS
jgi:hypothetical protein